MEASHFMPPVVVRRQEGQQGGEEGEFYVFMNLSRLQICIDGGVFFFFSSVIDWLGMVASDCE